MSLLGSAWHTEHLSSLMLPFGEEDYAVMLLPYARTLTTTDLLILEVPKGVVL